MSGRGVIVLVLLATGVAVVLASCLGLLLLRSPFSRLHAVGPATSLGALAVCAAVVVEKGFGAAGLEAIFVAAILVCSGPIVTHATARAARVRAEGEWRLRPTEKREAQKTGKRGEKGRR